MLTQLYTVIIMKASDLMNTISYLLVILELGIFTAMLGDME